jgi:hypothetical protein
MPFGSRLAGVEQNWPSGCESARLEQATCGAPISDALEFLCPLIATTATFLSNIPFDRSGFSVQESRRIKTTCIYLVIPQPWRTYIPEMEPEEYERDNVHQVYEQIATHFSSTRYKVHAGQHLIPAEKEF